MRSKLSVSLSVDSFLQAGISTDVFKQSFTEAVSDAKLGEGKSGMFFFTTWDRKFIIKTLKKAELSFLFHTKFLQDYYHHLTQNRESRLCRFYGRVVLDKFYLLN